MKIRCLAAVACAVLVSGAAEGAVTLRQRPGGQATLEVTAGPRGPWSAASDEAADAVNIAGDLFGDSLPAWEGTEDGLVAAWIRAADDTLHVAVARGGAWRATVARVCELAHGVPVVRCKGDQCVVLWRSAGPTGAAETHLARVAVDAGGQPVLGREHVQDGLLLDAELVGAGLHVMVVDLAAPDVVDVVIAGAVGQDADPALEASCFAMRLQHLLLPASGSTDDLAVISPGPSSDPFACGVRATPGGGDAGLPVAGALPVPFPPIEPPLRDWLPAPATPPADPSTTAVPRIVGPPINPIVIHRRTAPPAGGLSPPFVGLLPIPVPPIDPLDRGGWIQLTAGDARGVGGLGPSVTTPNPPIEPPLFEPSAPIDPLGPLADAGSRSRSERDPRSRGNTGPRGPFASPPTPVDPWEPVATAGGRSDSDPSPMHGQWARSSVSSATPNASYDPWEPTAPAAHAEHDSDPTGAPAVGPPPVDGRFAASTWAGAVATQLAALDLVIWELEAGWTDSVVLTWWSAPRELSFVELAEDGPVLPVETLPAEHGPEHPHRLVHEAIRIVEDRH